MRRFLYVAFFLAACAGGQTQDPGANGPRAGAIVSGSGGSGGIATDGSGGGGRGVAGGAGGAPGSAVDKCGNNVIDEGEQCDGVNLGGESCETLNEGSSGKLLCAKCAFDTSMCFVEDTGPGEDTGIDY